MRRRRSAAAALAAVGVLAALAGTSAEARSVRSGATVPDRAVTWGTAGDSYASGEGIAGTGGQCARSDRAYGPLAADLLRQQRDWRIGTRAMVACTGAVSADVLGDSAHQPPLPAQIDVLGSELGRADVLTLSIGGNDIGFAEVLRDCLHVPFETWPSSWGELRGSTADPPGCELSRDELEERVRGLARAHRIEGSDRQGPALSELYARVADEVLADDGVLVVSGYPRLFAPSAQWPAWRGRECNFMAKEDADLLGGLTELLDEVLRAEVLAADPTGERIVYQSRLELFDNAGDSRSLCGPPGVEWLNGVSLGLGDGSFRIEHSFHPNEPGHAATAEAVAEVLDRLLGGRAATTTTTSGPSAPAPTSTTAAEAPIDSGGTYEIGSRFSARCTIAWPTAPMRSRGTIQMRTTCAGVPGQFLFVDIVHPDPDLPVSPSRSSMLVEGTIEDVAVSELGFKVLVVWAEAVQLL